MFDFIIIGGGISGLYISYKILQRNSKAKLVIIEKNEIGGRSNQILFENKCVVTGAGIGRKKKDKLFFQLYNQLFFSIPGFNISS